MAQPPLILDTKKGQIRAEINECDDYPSINIYINDVLYCITEYVEANGFFQLLTYNQTSDEVVFRETIRP